MMEQVERFCVEQGLLQSGLRIVAACSGGADSLAMLEILWRLREKYRLRILAAHFEHGIRGEESRADARFVRDYCRRRGIPFEAGGADVPRAAERMGLSLETAARELRYNFLEEVRRCRGYDVLAVAHHADDQAETVLMRILRGTGTRGLSAMRPRSGCDGHIIRPLLGVTKRQIRDWCRREHLTPREDSTNWQPDGTRNRIRLQVIPALRRMFNPELTQALCQLSDVAACEQEYLDQQAEPCWQQAHRICSADGGVELNCSVLAAQHPAVQRILLRRFWRETTGSSQDLGFVQTELLRGLCLQGTTGSRQELPNGYTAERSYGWIFCRRVSPAASTGQFAAVPLAVPGDTCFGSLCCHAVWRKALPLKTGADSFYLSPDSLSEPLVLRFRQPGDTIRLPAGRKKLKKLLIDDRIPQERRDSLPLLASGREILWVIGHRRSICCPVEQALKENRPVLYLTVKRREEHDHD